MKQPKLTAREQRIYMNIVKYGKMDEMFDLGYVIGQLQGVRETMLLVKKHHENTKTT